MYAKKNSGKKVVATLLAIALLIGGVIGGTIAYLMDSTNEIKNTFTVGDVDIDLIETKPENKTAKMVPGATIEKDPTVTVTADSENCYVFVKVQESANFDDFMTYNIAEDWEVVENNADDNYVVYGRSAKANDRFSVLENDKVTVKADVTKNQMDLLTTDTQPTLTFTAYAIQSANLVDTSNNAVNTLAGAWALIPKTNP